MGDIGMAVAKRLQGWGMDIVAVRKNIHQPLGLPPGTISNVYPLDELPFVVSRSDFTICAIKYHSKENRHLFGRRVFSQFNGSAFINVARGGLVDEAALYDALQNGSVGQAGLDVFEHEPLAVTSPLQTHPNVMLTSHSAGVTDLFYERGAQAFAENCHTFAQRRAIKYCVNKPARPRVELS
ncbi:hypothetical protein Unana1_05014 [Umbelopsis nana]